MHTRAQAGGERANLSPSSDMLLPRLPHLKSLLMKQKPGCRCSLLWNQTGFIQVRTWKGGGGETKQKVPETSLSLDSGWLTFLLPCKAVMIINECQVRHQQGFSTLSESKHGCLSEERFSSQSCLVPRPHLWESAVSSGLCLCTNRLRLIERGLPGERRLRKQQSS